jgi:hypothetical protein
MAAGFSVLSDSEAEDFHSSIKQLGFNAKDFELSQASAPPSGGGIQPIVGTVTVKRKSTGSSKTYQAGHGSSWPASFHDDLRKGVFGAP